MIRFLCRDPNRPISSMLNSAYVVHFISGTTGSNFYRIIMGAKDEISNFDNFSLRFFICSTHIPSIITIQGEPELLLQKN